MREPLCFIMFKFLCYSATLFNIKIIMTTKLKGIFDICNSYRKYLSLPSWTITQML